MHEYSIVQSLMNRVEAEAAERRATAVKALTLRIGELSGVEPVLLTTAFETFVEKTICEGATLSIIRVPVSWACPRCERSIVQGAFLQCPECSVPATLRSGDEIILERIEMEVPDV
ncbi:MAG: hydrogenase maturation nickel metallochaperone HypA [Acidobacteria bacterium]|nr:hydrogenase maturation nickel metallochaperone HypA [Acidobacteriota bacterium]